MKQVIDKTDTPAHCIGNNSVTYNIEKQCHVTSLSLKEFTLKYQLCP